MWVELDATKFFVLTSLLVALLMRSGTGPLAGVLPKGKLVDAGEEQEPREM